MKKQKSNRADRNYIPSGQRPTRFINVLDDWKRAVLHAKDVDEKTVQHPMEYFVSPEKKVYRRAFMWEHPNIVIGSPLMMPEQEIRLKRVRNKKLCKEVRRAVRRS